MAETEYFVITYENYQNTKLKLDWKNFWDSCPFDPCELCIWKATHNREFGSWYEEFNLFLLQYGLTYEKAYIERPIIKFKIIDKKIWVLARIKYGL
jgi:hypothetical protein